MAAKTREEIVKEYQQEYAHSPTALSNLEKLLKGDIASCDESIAEERAKEIVTAKWVQYWEGVKADYQLELDVCQEFLAQVAG